MSENALSSPIIVLITSLGTALCGAVIWICKNKCTNQQLDIDSGCCRFHADNRLREIVSQTIRDEIAKSRESILESQSKADD